MSETALSAPALAQKRSSWSGWLMAIGSSAAFSVGPVAATSAIRLGLNPTTMLFLRFLITIALLGTTLALTAPARLRMDRRGLAFTVGAGLVQGVGMLTFFWSLTRLHTSVASMLFSLFPLVVLLLLALRGERFTYRNGLRLALGIAGVYFLIGPGGQADWVGVLMVGVSILTSSVQTVAMQWFLQEYDARAVTLYMVSGMAVVVSGWWLIEGSGLRVPGWQAWAWIGVLVVVTTYLARLGLFGAVRRLGSGQVALLVPLETFLTVLWSMWFLGDRLSPLQWAGGGLILFSTLLAVERLGRAQWPARWRAWTRV